MPTFLSRQQVYRLLQRELPEEVYPDGPASAYFSTADNDSIAGVAASGYQNLSVIYDNYFPQFTVEKLYDWEIAVFGFPSTSALSVADRQKRILEVLRAENNISYGSILDQLTRFFADTGLDFDLVNWGDDGGWRLEVSQLDVETYLSFLDPLYTVGIDCSFDYLGLGLTAQKLADAQQTAYTYEVRIIGHADAGLVSDLDALLKRIEPARSAHYIYNDFPGPVDP